MYQAAQKKSSVDTVFGAVLSVFGIVWATSVLALAPIHNVAAERLAAQKGEPIQMVLTESGSSNGEVTTFPARGLDSMLDKKYA